MEIDIYQGHKVEEACGVCVVIDVLRAFTSAAFAFDSGAKEIVFVSTPEEAFQKHARNPALLLMGEMEGLRIEGFHYDNSPSQMRDADLSGKTLVQRTSSGTQGVIGVRHAPTILISSFVVAEATYRRLLELNPSHVSFIATGRNNGDEDLALAEYLQGKLRGEKVDLQGYLNRVSDSCAAQRMIGGAISYGKEDLKLALDADCFSFAMEVKKEKGELIGRVV